MPIPENFSETLAKKIFSLLSEKNLITTNEPPETFQSMIDGVISEDLEKTKFEDTYSAQPDTPKKNLSLNIARLKEQLAKQKSLNRKAEIEKTKLINEGQLKQNNLTDFYKKQLEDEKVVLLNKLKSFEEANKRYEQESKNPTEEKSKIAALKEELKNIQELLASEKQVQEKLLEEKRIIEEELIKAQADLNDSSEDVEKSNLIKDAIKKIKNYKDENSKLQKQISTLLDKFKKEKANVPAETDKELKKKIAQFQNEIKELKNKLNELETEREELLALQEEQNLKQTQEEQLPEEIKKELNLQEEESKIFKIINQLNDESFNTYKTALNSKVDFEKRINQIDAFIAKTKEDIEKITEENKDSDSSENHSIEVIDYFSDQIKKKEAIKKVLFEHRELEKEVDGEEQPIIIQKKVIKKHSAHGGSWKVAYADFVTAMMAFFLMLWLLSMLSQEARDNLKEYFKSYKAFKHSGQEISKGKDSIRTTDAVRISNKEDKLLDQKRMIEEFKNRFKGADEHLKVIEVPGGIRIQIMDIMDKPMFEIGSAKFMRDAVEIFEFLAERIKGLPGTIIIEGHTDALPYSQGEKTNWELSMERASTARLYLMKNGVEAKRIKRIIAYGPSEPVNPDDIFDPKNRRINIILLNEEEKKSEEKKSEESLH